MCRVPRVVVVAHGEQLLSFLGMSDSDINCGVGLDCAPPGIEIFHHTYLSRCCFYTPPSVVLWVVGSYSGVGYQQLARCVLRMGLVWGGLSWASQVYTGSFGSEKIGLKPFVGEFCQWWFSTLQGSRSACNACLPFLLRVTRGSRSAAPTLSVVWPLLRVSGCVVLE